MRQRPLHLPQQDTCGCPGGSWTSQDSPPPQDPDLTPWTGRRVRAWAPPRPLLSPPQLGRQAVHSPRGGSFGEKGRGEAPGTGAPGIRVGEEMPGSWPHRAGWVGVLCQPRSIWAHEAFESRRLDLFLARCPQRVLPSQRTRGARREVARSEAELWAVFSGSCLERKGFGPQTTGSGDPGVALSQGLSLVGCAVGQTLWVSWCGVRGALGPGKVCLHTAAPLGPGSHGGVPQKG